jgi:flagellar protein FlaG
VWVKNIGIDPIVAPTSIDVYYGNITAVQRIPYNAAGGEDTWRYNSLPTIIQKMDTVQIKITDTQLVANKTYFVRITAPNGVYADYVIST